MGGWEKRAAEIGGGWMDGGAGEKQALGQKQSANSSYKYSKSDDDGVLVQNRAEQIKTWRLSLLPWPPIGNTARPWRISRSYGNSHG